MCKKNIFKKIYRLSKKVSPRERLFDRFFPLLLQLQLWNVAITIIGGAGHVGLAFALICTSKNIKVHIHDTNKKSINLIKKGVMPHKEKNGSVFLKKAMRKNLLSYSSEIDNIKINKI